MQNTSRRLRVAALGLSLLAGVLPTTAPLAAPVTGQVLDKASVVDRPGCYGIVIKFNFPMQYISHFPLEQADILRVRLRPIISGTETTDVFNNRETVRPSHTHDSPLVDVTYEGDAVEPHLIVQFTHPVAYTLEPGGDFRSLLIQVSTSEKEAAQHCSPDTDPIPGTSP